MHDRPSSFSDFRALSAARYTRCRVKDFSAVQPRLFSFIRFSSTISRVIACSSHVCASARIDFRAWRYAWLWCRAAQRRRAFASLLPALFSRWCDTTARRKSTPSTFSFIKDYVQQQPLISPAFPLLRACSKRRLCTIAFDYRYRFISPHAPLSARRYQEVDIPARVLAALHRYAMRARKEFYWLRDAWLRVLFQAADILLSYSAGFFPGWRATERRR